MKRLLFFTIFLLAIISISSSVFAQSMMGNQSNTISDDHTAREEAEGKEIWEKLQAKQITCSELTDEDYGALGEYFMGQAMGGTQKHMAMNQMMTNMMGEKGEEQMHIILGKRSSDCDINTKLPSGYDFMPMMMWMIGGGGNSMMGYGGWNNMMGGWGGFGFGWVFMILFWGFLILAIIALLRWLFSGSKGQSNKTPLEILQERFAKGEIDKKEYEEKAKILSKSR